MDVNIENLKENIKELNLFIEEYESNSRNLYNELSNCSIFWQDNKSTMFFEKVNIEKIAINESINEIKEIYKIYTYILNKYSQIGNKIKFDIKLKNEIITKCDKYINYINDIKYDLRNLDYEFDYTIANKIYNEINKLGYIINDLTELKKNIKKHFELFEEIEKEVNLKISKIKIDVLKLTEINNFI